MNFQEKNKICENFGRTLFHKNRKIWCKKSWLSDDIEGTEKDNRAKTSVESLRKKGKTEKKKKIEKMDIHRKLSLCTNTNPNPNPKP